MAPIRPCKAHCFVLLSALALAVLVGCDQQNSYVPPPPATVGVTKPVRQPVTDYLELTGTTQAINSVDLVARVEGFLQAIKVPDGALVEKGDVLFVIEPEPYEAKLEQARAGIAEQQAALARASSEYRRQLRLVKQNASSEAALEHWRAERDQAQAGLDSATASAHLAAIELGYTQGHGAL
ncbi:MAG: efflux RND transporter periplasmic adaptor subunit [Nitrococcus sp.]|nr:efflux RND transporter periplasmic adaptor subunit [Nitrococcus sp.]